MPQRDGAAQCRIGGVPDTGPPRRRAASRAFEDLRRPRPRENANPSHSRAALERDVRAGAFRGRADRIRPSPEGGPPATHPARKLNAQSLADWTGRRWVPWRFLSQHARRACASRLEARARTSKTPAPAEIIPLVALSARPIFPGARICLNVQRPSRRRMPTIENGRNGPRGNPPPADHDMTKERRWRFL